MNAMTFASRHMVWILAVAPVTIFAVYISWLIVPEIVRIVVPEVVRAVLRIFE